MRNKLSAAFVVVMALSLLIALLAPGSTSAKITPKPKPTGEPVKIGVVNSYSGPAAPSGWLSDGSAAVMEWLINDQQGGILGGRPVKFVNYDCEYSVAKAGAGALKLITQDKVCAITQGGVTEAFMGAVADVTDKNKTLFVPLGASKFLVADHKWVVSSIYTRTSQIDSNSAAVLKVLKPKTAAYFGEDDIDSRECVDGVRKELEAAGVKTVYQQWYTPGTQDFSPYLTKIKYATPDVLVTYLIPQDYVVMCKQIKELGGWGKIKHFATTEQFTGTKDIFKLPGAQGSYVIVAYAPGASITPGGVAFQKAWAAKAAADKAFASKYGKVPLGTNAYSWTANLIAVKAIELAGTDDTAKVAQAARSGNLEVDTPFGHAHVQTNGSSGIQLSGLVKLAGGKLVPVKMP